MTKKGSITILSPSTKTKTVVSFRDGPSFRSSSVSPRSCASHEKTCGAKSPQPSLAQLVHLSHDTTAGSFSDQYQKPLLVLKVGTSTIMETTTANFCLSNLGTFVDCVCNMKEQGYQVVLVSSGAVGAGIIHMKLKERPNTLQGKQAASAVGQCRMMRLYEDLFAIREQKVGQLILTRSDLMDRTRFINFKLVLKELLRLDVVPIINENDSIATAQLRFGDNDTLAAYVAVSLGAQWLFLLTDVDCLYTANPRVHPNAKPIPFVSHLDDVYKILDDRENTGTSWGSGGMRTKIVAAKIATATGIHTALCHGRHPERVLDVIRFAEAHGQTPAEWEAELARWRKQSQQDNRSIMRGSKSEASFEHHRHGTYCAPHSDFRGLQHHHFHSRSDLSKAISDHGDSSSSLLQVPGKNSIASNTSGLVTVDRLDEMPYLGTIFAAQECTQHIRDQRRWILSLPVRGQIYVDRGAARALIEGKKSLFAAGITKVEGVFYENEAVALVLEKNSLSLPSSTTSFTTIALSVSEPPLSPGSSITGDTRIDSTFTTDLISKSTIYTSNNSKMLISDSDVIHHSGHCNGPSRHRHRNLSHPPKAKQLVSTTSLKLPIKTIDAPEDEAELGRCLVNFASFELLKIKGKRSDQFYELLGYECDPEVAYRQNIIFVNPCPVYGCSQSYCDHPVPSPRGLHSSEFSS